MNKKYRYIYNPRQKDFYLKNGAKLISAGVNPSTNKNYWVFNDGDIQNLFQLWCELGKYKKVDAKSTQDS